MVIKEQLPVVCQLCGQLTVANGNLLWGSGLSSLIGPKISSGAPRCNSVVMVRSSINPLNPLAGARLHYYSFPAAVISRSIPMKDKLGEIVLRWRIHTPTSVMLHPPVAVRDIVFRRF